MPAGTIGLLVYLFFLIAGLLGLAVLFVRRAPCLGGACPTPRPKSSERTAAGRGFSPSSESRSGAVGDAPLRADRGRAASGGEGRP
ncbi:MAG: hypothetical protein KM312_04080 [Hydrogenibacillus schlegelii]|uniref:Uncharacterized protein n=1 Tax=Hydrogenibacillus schlegelii TaxID=1484 RepID=A0A947CVG1_HYDSH|nr:hypothetical protein [Hydrogenibacillus schlegelii]